MLRYHNEQTFKLGEAIWPQNNLNMCPSIIAKIKGLKLYFFLGIFDTYQSTEKPFLPCSLTASFGASVHLYNVIESQSLNFQDFNKKFSAKMIRYKNFWLPQIVRQSSIGRKEKRKFCRSGVSGFVNYWHLTLGALAQYVQNIQTFK